jgi:hypothetical protein
MARKSVTKVLPFLIRLCDERLGDEDTPLCFVSCCSLQAGKHARHDSGGCIYEDWWLAFFCLNLAGVLRWLGGGLEGWFGMEKR